VLGEEVGIKVWDIKNNQVCAEQQILKPQGMDRAKACPYKSMKGMPLLI